MVDPSAKVERSKEQWREQLSPEQFQVAREGGTERAFTGIYWNHKGKGTYQCVCCGAYLFNSDTKFDSGTGWPSFWEPLPGAVREDADRSLFMTRTEISCRSCGGHLGHVFSDGPRPTGLRYCMNGAAMTFTPASA